MTAGATTTVRVARPWAAGPAQARLDHLALRRQAATPTAPATYPPKVPGGAGSISIQNNPAAYDYWRKAVLWPSATHMTHLRDFLAGLSWWPLEPAPDLVKNQSAEHPRKIRGLTTAPPAICSWLVRNHAEIVLDLSALSPWSRASEGLIP